MAVFDSHGQNRTDSIEVKINPGNTVFLQNGKKLRPRHLLEITQSNPEAYKEMKTAKSNYDAGFAIGFAGGFLVGWTIGSALTEENPNWILAGVGASLIVISLPFSNAYTKHAKNGVEIHNSRLRPTGLNNIDLKIGLTCNGVGIKVLF